MHSDAENHTHKFINIPDPLVWPVVVCLVVDHECVYLRLNKCENKMISNDGEVLKSDFEVVLKKDFFFHEMRSSRDFSRIFFRDASRNSSGVFSFFFTIRIALGIL